MATQVQEQGPGPPDPAQLQQLLAVLRTMLSPLPKPTKQPNLLRCDSRFRFSSQTLFSFCDQIPKPTLSGEGIFFSLSPGNTPLKLGGGVWGPWESRLLVQPRWESEAPNSSISFSLLEAEGV